MSSNYPPPLLHSPHARFPPHQRTRPLHSVLITLARSLLPTRPAWRGITGNVSNDRLSTLLRLRGSYYDKHLDREIPYNVTGIPPALGIMFTAGIISGVLGIGAGVVKVLAHEIAMKVPTKVSTATSNFMIGVTAATAAGVYLRRGLVLLLVVPVATAVVIGAMLGTVLMERMSNALIRKSFRSCPRDRLLPNAASWIWSRILMEKINRSRFTRSRPEHRKRLAWVLVASASLLSRFWSC